MVGLLAETTAPTVTDNMWLTVAVALLAALPGILGLWYSWRKSKREDETAEDQVGLGFAKTAFHNMETEVARLAKQADEFDTQRVLWEHDRRTWAEDKGNLMRKINALTEQLHLTNGYLQLLLMMIEGEGLTPPKPPSGLNLRRLNGKDKD